MADQIIQLSKHLFDTEIEETMEYFEKEGIEISRQIPAAVQEYYKKI